MADEKKKQQRQVQLQIQVPEDVANGIYANLAMVNHSDAEFTLDFIFVQPQTPRATVRSRVVTSPRHMKRLVAALQDNVAKYEAKHGVIDTSNVPPVPTGQYKH